MLRTSFAFAFALLALACSKKETAASPDTGTTTTTTPTSSASSTLAPPPPPLTKASLVLPPVRSDVEPPCTGTFVPLCFESLPGGCCGTSVTYAHCGRRTKSQWECPTGMALGATCPGSDRGCVDAIKNAVDSYGR